MANLHIEALNMGDFKYRNWILSNDEGDIVAFDQDVKFCIRVLGVDPATFIETYMDGAASAPDMATMEANILFGIERRLEELDLSVNDLVLYEDA